MNEIRSETSDRLYFNGLKPDGSYGLSPKTAKELADHIWADRKREQDLAIQLEQAMRNTDKVVEIVNYLTAQSLALLEGEPMSREAWITALARHLLMTILGEEAAGAGNVQELARKLEVETQQGVEKIVKAFLTKRWGNQDLQELLLPQKTDDVDNYMENLVQLKLRVQHMGRAIIRDYLSPEQLLVLESTPAARAIWLAKMCQQLRELPIEPFRALRESSNLVIDSIRQLVTRLQALPDSGIGWHTQLIHDLNPTSRLWESIAWSTLIDILERDLLPVVQADSVMLPGWRSLLGVLNAWLDILLDSFTPGPRRKGLVSWADPLKLDEAGWGVIFPAMMSPERLATIQEALEPLLALRRRQAGELYKVYMDEEGYRPGENARNFLSRHNADPSQPANPKGNGVPYYLLLVGSPEEIPFEFQYGLDVQYAVGRVDFDDGADYCAYARSVVAAEADDFQLAPDVVFFPVLNSGDETTWLSAQYLVKPLAERLEKRIEVARSGKEADTFPDWKVTVISSEQTTREKLLDVLSCDKAPALLFTASHGMQFDPGDPAKQRDNQGALVCADWQGPAEKQVLPDYYLSGDVLAAHQDVNLLGTIAFLFACYGAGTPRLDDYHRCAFMDRGAVIAERPFTAALPKAMLSLAQGGALAVIGHIERVWSLSYLGPGQHAGPGELRHTEHLAVFESAVDRLLHGYPVGAAMDYFDMRYAALSAELTGAFESRVESDAYLAELWTSNHDARGYVVIGDPAVRLKVMLHHDLD
ncbi:MAG: hypothetical protein JXR84_12495 [Anaerolineae bacterium]|nr:hypothetical protein [Anaerolineae bacterium]